MGLHGRSYMGGATWVELQGAAPNPPFLSEYKHQKLDFNIANRKQTLGSAVLFLFLFVSFSFLHFIWRKIPFLFFFCGIWF